MLLNSRICCSSMGEISILRHIVPRTKYSMPSYHRMPQANICGRFVFVSGKRAPDSRRDVRARMERTKQMEQETHSLFVHNTERSRLMLRKDFPTSVKSSYFPTKVVRCNEWQRRSMGKSQLGMVNLNEEPAKEYDNP